VEAAAFQWLFLEIAWKSVTRLNLSPPGRGRRARSARRV